ncbi:hypothetical protein SNE40_002482 [Patella caerulea]|uniref:Phospholipase A2-like central domain-containing protein n=1 Tax=Patella caerulea TaxID=87958 RepID=A0AAN8Q351_PATCE
MELFRSLLVYCILGIAFAKVYFVSDTKRTLEIDESGDRDEICYIRSDRAHLNKMFFNKDIDVDVISAKKFDELVDACSKHIKQHIKDEEHAKRLIRKKRLIRYPGTIWCGAGNGAKQYSDLGELVATDSCCREHDHCTIKIERLQTKYGLFNYGPWTNNDCACDDKFYNCLKAVKNGEEEEAAQVGYVFFDLLAIDCIRSTGKTVLECVSRSWWGTCVEHRSTEKYEWVDPKPFSDAK